MLSNYEYQKKTSPSNSIVTSLWRYLLNLIRDFCNETSIHGFNHIAVPGRHWTERLLWFALTVAAVCGAIGVSLDQWHRYNDNPTVVTLEKNFRYWRFSLPAVTACPKNRADPAKMERVIKSYWDVSPMEERYAYYSRFVSVVANSELFHLDGYEEFRDDQSLNVDLFQLAVDVMPEPTVKVISSEDAKAVSFKWTSVMTESGVCFTTNSLVVADVALVEPEVNVTQNYPITCKYSPQTCYVTFEVQNVTYFYSHSPYDVMDIATRRDEVFLRLSRTTQLTVTESNCAKGVRELTPQRRGCRYTDEPLVHGRQVYSTNTCRLSCRSKNALRICGCRPFYYFYGDGPVCSPSGMYCLATHENLLTNNAGRCRCTAQCMDTVFNDIATKDNIWENGPFITRGSIRYVVQIPRTRYTREIVFHFQDLIVSFGGAAGLFLGASFIGFVEVLYFITERIFKHLFHDNRNASIIMLNEKRTKVSYETQRVIELTRVLEEEPTYNRELKI